jgi:hypothetical protein
MSTTFLERYQNGDLKPVPNPVRLEHLRADLVAF